MKTPAEWKTLFESSAFARQTNYSGPLGPEYNPSGTRLRLWAPTAQKVSVNLYRRGDGGACMGTLPLERHGQGVWSVYLPGDQHGHYYTFTVEVDGTAYETGDPYARTAGVNGLRSMILDAPRIDPPDWNHDHRVIVPASRRTVWEVSVRDFSQDPACGVRNAWRGKFMAFTQKGTTLSSAGTFPTCLDYLKRLGVGYVQLMPIFDFGSVDESRPLTRQYNWGYDPTNYNVPEGSYSTDPTKGEVRVRECKEMIASLHAAGIGVIMDFVPVHFAANADALANFDGTHLYEYDSDVGHSEWGTCNFNYYRREVCSFLNSAAALWMEVYHCDGIRMDAISRALYWQGDPARGVNEGAVTFLRNLNHGLNDRWPTGVYMAEDSTNFLKVTAPTRYDGIGFDYKWDMGWMHDTLDYFATPFGQRPDAYGKIIFSMHYFYNELYLLALSHDEVVHGKKTIIDKLWGTYEEKCAQLRTLYFYMYAHPGKKLNFMGNELGHFREWDEKRELDWDLLKYPFHDAFQKYFGALSRLYATQPALYAGEYDPRCFEWVASESRDEGVYAWLRKGRGENLLCIMNTQDHAHKKFPLYLRFPCSAEEVLNTESPEWGGALKGRRKTKLHTTDGGVFGRDYTLTVDLPAMGSCLLRLAPEAPNPDAARISANKALNAKRRAARSTKAAANSNK